MATRPSWLASTFAALAIRPYRILWLGTLFSFMAFFMSTVVQSVVAFDLMGTNRAVGYVVAAQGIAMVLLGPIGGAYADRLPKKTVVALGQVLTMVVFALLSLALYAGAIRVWHLAAGSLLMGASFAFLGPARQALVVEFVPGQRRGNALALSQIANTASRVVGPGVAGALLGWSLAGATGAYAVMAILYAISAASLVLLPASPPRADASDTHVLRDLRDGLSYVFERPRLRLQVFIFIALITVGFPHVTVLPGLVENELGRSVADISVLYLVSACGALVSSLFVARYADSPNALGIYVGMGLVFGVALMGLSAVSSFAMAAVVMFGVGVGSGGFQALSGAVIVRETESLYIGRVMSLTMLAFGFFGLMALPVGVLADAVGERVALAATGFGVCSLSALLWLRWPKDDDETFRASRPETGNG